MRGGAAVGGGQGINFLPGGGVQFNSANTFVGPTTISQGTLRYGVANALAVANPLVINSGGTLDLNGFAAGITSLINGLAGGGTPWVYLGRGLGRDVPDSEQRLRGGTGTSEVFIRNQFAAWLEYLTGDQA